MSGGHEHDSGRRVCMPSTPSTRAFDRVFASVAREEALALSDIASLKPHDVDVGGHAAALTTACQWSTSSPGGSSICTASPWGARLDGEGGGGPSVAMLTILPVIEMKEPLLSTVGVKKNTM